MQKLLWSMQKVRVQKTGCMQKCVCWAGALRNTRTCVQHWSNPVLSVQEKFSLICAATVGDAPAERELARFIMLVLKNRRESFLQYICLSFLDLYRKDRRIGIAKLTTAVPVSREVWERIRNSASHLCMLKWSYRLMLILLLKVDLYSTLTIFAWMPVLLLSWREWNNSSLIRTEELYNSD